MGVTSTTLAGVNVFQFSGAVTDAEIKAAWAGTISEGRYVLNRAIYLDNTADLTSVTGGFFVDFGTQVNPAIILHTGRDKTKSTFKNFTFFQRTGLSVQNRIRFVLTWNGSTLGTPVGADGLSQNGGGMIYAVAGNPGGGDPRFLNEMSFAGLEGATIYSQEFTEQELQPVVGQTSVLKGITFEKCFGFPQISTPSGSVNVLVYRSFENTQHPTQIPVRVYPNNGRYASICYVDSYVTRNNLDVSERLIDTFGSNASNIATIVILNNFTRESWFGASKTNMAITTWSATNVVYGGVLKKIRFVNGQGGVVKCYDSRSTTAAQKCSFKESGFIDFLDPNTSAPVNAQGEISIMILGAIATGSTAAITRLTDQKYLFIRFGTRVILVEPDMTSGDNDLSAFSPVILTAQNGLVRTQAEIQAAPAPTTFREVAEELHNLAITSTGISSYAAPYEGNFFELEGRVLNTAFDSVVLDPTATSKIAYDQATNTLTLKSALISSGSTVTEWRNIGGTFSFENGAKITGVFADDDGSRANITNIDPEGFGVTWYIRYKKTADTTWTNVNGTGNNATILIDLDEYTIMARVPGYDWKTIEVDTNESLGIDLNLQYQVSANNTPQYTMSFDAALEASIQYDATKMAVAVENTTGAITQPGFAELYQATQRIQHIPSLVWFWTHPVTANSTSQKILIPDGNPISFFLTEASTATVKVTCPVIHLSSGQSADDRVKGNSAGYSIILGSPATAESAGLQSAIVSDLMAKLGGTGFEVDTHSLVNVKATVNALENYDDTILQGKADDIKAKTDILENYNDATVQSKLDGLATDLDSVALESTAQAIKTKTDTLSNYDDVALIAKVDAIKSVVDSVKTTVEDKTGYSLTTAQVEAIAVAVESHLLDEGDSKMLINAIVGAIGNTNVDQVALVAAIRSDIERAGGKLTALGTPLQASDYVAPDNAKIADTNTKVSNLSNYNDSAVISKIEGLGTPLQAVDYVAPANSEIASIKETVLELPSIEQINESIENSAPDLSNVPEQVWEYSNRTLNGDVVE